MRIGGHVSAAGSLDRAIDRAMEIGAETVQLFVSPPQGWHWKDTPAEQIRTYQEKAQQADIAPTFFHGIYLVNLGSQSPENLAKGIESLTNYMRVAAQLGAAGVIFHAGSHKGVGFEGIFRQTVESIQRILQESPEGPWLIVENSAGMGQHIGAKFEELGHILQAVGSPRVRICLDTQHCFAAGYNVADPEGLERTLEEFDREVGLDKLVAVHANDSKQPLGSGVDRHENIGEGHIGLQGFEVIMGHPAFRDVPLLLEVPGFEGTGPDRPTVAILKEIRQRLGVPV